MKAGSADQPTSTWHGLTTVSSWGRKNKQLSVTDAEKPVVGHCGNAFEVCVWLLLFPVSFRTLVIGAAGSLMLDLYGWESVFYASGLLSVLWAYCMWKYLLKGEGKWCVRSCECTRIAFSASLF